MKDASRLREAVDLVMEGDPSGRGARDRARARVLADAHARRRSARRDVQGDSGARVPPRSAIVVALLGAAAASAILYATASSPPPAAGVPSPPLRFTVGERGVAGQPGVLVSTRERPDALRFSDGTEVTLGPGTHARVTSVTTDGASVLVERGEARLDVVHRGDTTRWSVDLGPFQVRVTGTRFDVAWVPEVGRLRVNVREGAVVVAGCGLEPKSVRAGESLEHVCAEAAALPPPPSPPAPAAPAPEASAGPSPVSRRPTDVDASVVPEAPAPAVVSDAGPSVVLEASAPASPSFLELFRRGDLAESYALAAQRFDAICETGSEREVLTAGEVARLTGHIAEARRAFLRVRGRFPGTASASSAAFYLGLLAFHEGSFRAAAELFEASGAARGPFAREASGRAIEALERAGDQAGARRAAEAYLAQHPDGPHAVLAARVLGRRP